MISSFEFVLPEGRKGTDTMDIKVLHKSSTFSSFTNSGHKIGNWFATFGDRRRKNSMKGSKSLTLGKEVAS
jgi:hypothetical protein